MRAAGSAPGSDLGRTSGEGGAAQVPGEQVTSGVARAHPTGAAGDRIGQILILGSTARSPTMSQHLARCGQVEGGC